MAGRASAADRWCPFLSSFSGPVSIVTWGFKWWSVLGSNQRPHRCQRCALPTELTDQTICRMQALNALQGVCIKRTPAPRKRKIEQ